MKELARQVDILSGRLEGLRTRERDPERSRRELVAGVSHDLGTPLAAVSALAEALEDRLVSTEAEVAEYHKRIRKEISRISQLVDDLFDLSRIDAGSLQLQLELVAVNDLISEALAQAAPLAQQKGSSVGGADRPMRRSVSAACRRRDPLAGARNAVALESTRG